MSGLLIGLLHQALYWFDDVDLGCMGGLKQKVDGGFGGGYLCILENLKA